MGNVITRLLASLALCSLFQCAMGADHASAATSCPPILANGGGGAVIGNISPVVSCTTSGGPGNGGFAIIGVGDGNGIVETALYGPNFNSLVTILYATGDAGCSINSSPGIGPYVNLPSNANPCTIAFTYTDGAGTVTVTLVASYYGSVTSINAAGGGFGGTPPSAMSANSASTPQSTAVSTAFPNPLAVTVTSAGNSPVPGVNVTFTAPGTASSGVFSGNATTITVATDASGIAAVPFSANSKSGGPYVVSAAASGLTTVNFSLTNTVGAPATIAVNAGNNQATAISTPFATALSAIVRDAGGNPVPNIAVAFAAPPSGASGVFSGNATTVTTNASGIATAPALAANATAGAYTVTASAGGVATSASFDLSNIQSPNAIAFAPLSDRALGSGTFTVSASASSGLPVTVSSLTGTTCSLSGTTVSLLRTGLCTLQATQSGNNNVVAAAPVSRGFNIIQATATVALSASSATSLIGQSVTLIAVVSPAGATGTVTFFDGTTSLCSSVALANATAACSAAFTSGGAHALTAVYNGSTSYAAATSSSVPVTITDQTAKTTQLIGQFLSQRNNQILSNEPDANRQIDRLNSMPGGGSAAAAGGLALGRTSSAPLGLPGPGTAARLGDGPSGLDMARMTPTTSGRVGQVFGLGPDQIPAGRLALGSDVTSERMAGQPAGPINPAASTAGGNATMGPFHLAGNSDGAPQFSFSGSLSDALRQSATAEQRKLAAAGPGLTPSPGNSRAAPFNPFDIWVEGKYAGFANSGSAGGFDGHFGLVSIGADYVLNRSLLIGTMVQIDSTHQHSETQATDIKGTGWMAGPYATVRLTDQVFWQARAAWGRSSNTVSPFLSYTDSFETERWLLSSSLTGRWQSGAWGFRPSASIAYMEDTSHSYQDTFGVLIPSVKSRLGQAKAGPEVSYTFEPSKGFFVEPHAAAQVIWNFASDTTASGLGTVGGETTGPSGVRGRVELGIKSTTPSGIGVDVSGSYDGIGSSGYSAITGQAMVRVPF